MPAELPVAGRRTRSAHSDFQSDRLDGERRRADGELHRKLALHPLRRCEKRRGPAEPAPVVLRPLSCGLTLGGNVCYGSITTMHVYVPGVSGPVVCGVAEGEASAAHWTVDSVTPGPASELV